MDQWRGKVAIVTGASSGLGEAITKSLVQSGIHVIGLARREEKLKELADQLKGCKGSMNYLRCDVRKEEDILNAFQYADEKFGGVDILVNNAGIAFFETISDGNTEHMRAILEVNVLAPAITTRETIRSIRKRAVQGHIININSLMGRDAVLSTLPFSLYQASKFALHAMTRNVRQEINAQNDNIKITAIYPGFVKTEFMEANGDRSSLYDQAPYVKSEDIADSVMFALSAKGNVQLDEMMITPLRT